jgi:uncharacterized protein
MHFNRTESKLKHWSGTWGEKHLRAAPGLEFGFHSLHWRKLGRVRAHEAYRRAQIPPMNTKTPAPALPEIPEMPAGVVPFAGVDQPLSMHEWDELGDLFEALPEEVSFISLEALDGLIAAGVCGPRGISMTGVIELAFEDGGFPECWDSATFERFLLLVGRRWNEYARMLARPDGLVNDEDWVEPYLYEPEPEELAEAKAWKVPSNITEETHRPGLWTGRLWASGFMAAVREYRDDWFVDDEFADEFDALISLPLILELGYNPDHPRAKFDPEKMLPEMLGALPDFARLYRALDAKAYRMPHRRDAAKVGRNDPCSCGSGKKYKRCCGAGDGE